jgi:hypothetical protein
MKPEDKTAEDILKEVKDQVSKDCGYESWEKLISEIPVDFIERLNTKASLLAMSKVAEPTWDEALDAAIAKFEFAKTKAKTLVELIQLDAVLAILDTLKTKYPDKSTYLNNLFKKI